jgi:hypothetical protein
MVESDDSLCVPRMFVSLYLMGMFFRCSPPTFPCLGRWSGGKPGAGFVILQFINIKTSQRFFHCIYFNTVKICVKRGM